MTGAALAWILLAAPLHAQTDTAILRFDPPTLEVGDGQVEQVNIILENAHDVYGIDVRAEFDPAVVQVVRRRGHGPASFPNFPCLLQKIRQCPLPKTALGFGPTLQEGFSARAKVMGQQLEKLTRFGRQDPLGIREFGRTNF